MQLSILIPTHRTGLLACSRLAQAASWASPDMEVVIRDNSGDTQKRELISRFSSDYCKVVIVDECESLENFSEILKLAKGDFVYFLADDDFCFDRAIAALPGLLTQCAKDPTVVGVTGAFVVELSQGSSVVAYADVELDDAVARVNGYLNFQGTNMLTYSPLRRDLFNRVFNFMNTLPFYFSYHDQIQSLIILLNGKFVRLKRLLYLYDVGGWEATETGQAMDVDYYKREGLDPAINKLHWFLCGFEGALLVRNAAIFPDYSLAQRQAVADLWFSAMFARFKSQQRSAFNSPLGGEADKLCATLLTSTGQLSFHGMLAAICEFIALFSPEQAQRYLRFWAALLTPNNAASAAS